MDGQPTPQQTYRMRVLSVVEVANEPLTGREIAKAASLTYKQTIDALNALYNYGRVHRHGRKFMARWSCVRQNPPGELHPLDQMFLRMMKAKKK